jgi:hypothetical protein
MTEAEWLACKDPLAMLDFLRRGASVLVDRVQPELREELRRTLLRILTDRKFGFFACACCSVLLPALRDENSVKAVEVTELYLDGQADAEELEKARGAVSTANHPVRLGTPRGTADHARRTRLRLCAPLVLMRKAQSKTAYLHLCGFLYSRAPLRR